MVCSGDTLDVSGCKRAVSLPPRRDERAGKTTCEVPLRGQLLASVIAAESQEPQGVRVAFVAWEGARGLPAPLPSG